MVWAPAFSRDGACGHCEPLLSDLNCLLALWQRCTFTWWRRSHMVVRIHFF